MTTPPWNRTNQTNPGARTGSFKAVVRAGSDATEYLRAGAGPTVLLLLEEFAESIELLCLQYRVFVPLAVPGSGEFHPWLCSFLEGLGLTEVSILTDDARAARVAAFVQLEPSRVKKVALLAGPKPGRGGQALAGIADHPVLVVPPEGSLKDRLDKVVGFLGLD